MHYLVINNTIILWIIIISHYCKFICLLVLKIMQKTFKKWFYNKNRMHSDY